MASPTPNNDQVATRRWPDFFLDFAASATILAWGVVGLLREKWDDGLSIPLLALLFLNSVVVLLFLRRDRARSVASGWELACALPSVVIGPITLARAPEASSWHWLLSAAFVVACAWVTASLLTLGKNFAIFPAARGLTVRGLYDVVRHPAYAGELLMAIVAGFARLDVVTVIVVVLAIVATAWRIAAEEKLLRQSSDYGEYAARVKWRLLPGVW